MSELRQCQRQIHRHRGFPHAAFAARYGHQILHSRNRLSFRHLLLPWHPRWHIYLSPRPLFTHKMLLRPSTLHLILFTLYGFSSLQARSPFTNRVGLLLNPYTFHLYTFLSYSPHGTSCTSSPTHKDKGHSSPPWPPRAPALAPLPAPPPSDTANPSAAAPASAPTRAQNPATSAPELLPLAPPHSPLLRLRCESAASRPAVPAPAVVAARLAESARGISSGSFRYRSAPSCPQIR